MDLSKAINLARQKMDEHNLHYWNLELSNAERMLGQCSPKNKTVKLSRKYIALNEEPEILNTILHEIAHALEWERYRTAGHSWKWKMIARGIGCTAQRTADPNKVVSVPLKYVAVCKVHGEVGSYRKRVVRACSKCCNENNHGKFSKDYVLEIKLR